MILLLSLVTRKRSENVYKRSLEVRKERLKNVLLQFFKRFKIGSFSTETFQEKRTFRERFKKTNKELFRNKNVYCNFQLKAYIHSSMMSLRFNGSITDRNSEECIVMSLPLKYIQPKLTVSACAAWNNSLSMMREDDGV